MNGTKHNSASIETLPQIIATGPALLGCFSAGGKLERPDANKLGTKAKDIGQSLLAVLVKAFHCRRAPGRDECDGLRYTAAMEWRNAVELFAPNTRAVEYCWRQWEGIMHLPRRLAGPFSFVSYLKMRTI
jgi:hypothetical protein